MDPGDITQLLRRIDQGDAQAAEQILPLVYGELRKLAAAKMARESAGMTLQPTALVHEAWLRLGGDHQADWQSRAQFFAAAAEAMRRILIDNARSRQAARHGGGLQKLSASLTGFDAPAPEMSDAELLLLNEAMENLVVHDARKAEIVKQWYFVGLSREEVAEVTGLSIRTVTREWTYARAWLFAEMERLRQV